jgi:hypothetical protein
MSGLGLLHLEPPRAHPASEGPLFYFHGSAPTGCTESGLREITVCGTVLC